MPGYDTHYIFGTASYKKADAGVVKKIITSDKELYVLGLFGPDIFFYSFPELIKSGPNTGSLIHTSNINLFFRNMFDFAMSQSSYEYRFKSLSYFCGFLAHYSLDRFCHPYIYYRSGYNPFEGKSDSCLHKHFSLETDIDILLLNMFCNKAPKEFKKSCKLNLSSTDISFISKMLQYSINRSFNGFRTGSVSIKAAILSLQASQRLIKSCPEKLRVCINSVETHIIGRSYLSALIPGTCITNTDPLNLHNNQWVNPWEPEIIHQESFLKLMDYSKANILKLFRLLDKCLSEYNNNAHNCFEEFLTAIGNYSYHSNQNSIED